MKVQHSEEHNAGTSLKETSQKLVISLKNKISTKFKFWNCNKEGHIHANFKLRKRHKKDEKTSKMKIIPDVSRMKKNVDNLIIDGSINNRLFKLTVGTGANPSIIRPDLM